jgi:hypothetical protein
MVSLGEGFDHRAIGVVRRVTEKAGHRPVLLLTSHPVSLYIHYRDSVYSAIGRLTGGCRVAADRLYRLSGGRPEYCRRVALLDATARELSLQASSLVPTN